MKFVDQKLAEMDYTERAQFIRDAMVDKIERTLKIKVPNDLALPPGRMGKGGANYPSNPAAHVELNDDKASSTKATGPNIEHLPPHGHTMGYTKQPKRPARKRPDKGEKSK